jgi:hypothetical protein
MKTRLLALAILSGSPFLLSCGQSGAYGDMNSIIVATDPALWDEIRDSLYTALEPRVFTVRQERTFEVTFQDPSQEEWTNLRAFKQELLIGRVSDPWMAEVVDRLDEVDLSPPQILQVYNVWARGQNVTVILLSESGGAPEVFSLLEELHRLYDGQFREHAVSRMFVTGRDTALADSLAREAGFSLVVPVVYLWDRQDSVFVFRNDNPDPSELIRQVTVTWRSPGSEELMQDEILAWRAEIAAAYYGTPQDVDLGHVEAVRSELDGRQVVQVQAVWENPPDLDWPAGGPFVTRAVWCPESDRVYLLDAWLYAPGKAKYEYMIQLETILDSFRCHAS